MGEILARVRLTNAADEALARRGQLEPAALRSYEPDAMVDMGAVRSIIPVHVLERLGWGVRGRG